MGKDRFPVEPGTCLSALSAKAKKPIFCSKSPGIVNYADKSQHTISITPYKTLNSLNATDFMTKLRKVAPFAIKRIQTDNGLEFEKHFHNYPARPQINGCIERFNRTIQEQFLQWNLPLIDKPKEFNKKLIEYLLWYNLERGHHSLNFKTPMEAIPEHKFGANCKNLKKSSMLRYLTHANSFFINYKRKY